MEVRATRSRLPIVKKLSRDRQNCHYYIKDELRYVTDDVRFVCIFLRTKLTDIVLKAFERLS